MGNFFKILITGYLQGYGNQHVTSLTAARRLSNTVLD